MDPEIQLSSQVITHFKTLKTTLQVWLNKYQVVSANLPATKAKELIKRKKDYTNLLAELTAILSTAKIKETTDSVSLDDLPSYYEEAVELGIKMGTGANREIASSYQTAMDNFFAAYKIASEDEQEEWKEAKEELEESNRILKDKIKRAEEELAKRRANTPPGGYFRFIKGQKGDQIYYRLDWLSKMTNLHGQSYHRNNDVKNDQYLAGTNRYVIELYDASFDEVGRMTFTKSGTAYSLDKQGLQLFNMLRNPYLTLEETGNKKFPALEANSVPKNTTLKWSVALWTPVPQVGEAIELPDWNDYGFQALYKEFKTKCAKFRLGKEEAEALKEQMSEAVEQQKNLYRSLNIIYQELTTREDKKLLQQADEVKAVLKIWRKRIQTYEPLIAPLDYKDCLRPPVMVNIEMGYWTGAVSNPTQAIKDLEAAGVLDRLKAYPKAVIQVTATFDHGGRKEYTDNPTTYMDSGYSDKHRAKVGIPDPIVQRRDYLTVKAQNVTNLIQGIPGISNSQVVPNLTPGDTGEHMGSSRPFGERVIIKWINDGE